MGFINNIKRQVQSSSAVEQFMQPQLHELIPNRIRFDDGCDGYYNKGNWWDGSNEMPHQEYVEDAFDQYAHEFHSAETDEERCNLYIQNSSWMLQ